jgi:hypothetical protein
MGMLIRHLCSAAAILCLAAPARAQVVQPGQAAADHAEAAESAQDGKAKDEPHKSQGFPGQEGHVPAYDAPSNYQTVVRGSIRENDAIGDYDQPRWTASRLFPTTRVYVAPRGSLQLEYWLDTVCAFKASDDVRWRNQYELEIGLGYRLQLDLYLRTEQQGIHGKMELESEKLEVRWAFADWGKIPGNPTLYVEFSRFSEAAPTVETKLLLGGNLLARAHWGVNLVFERDLGGSDLFNQYGVTGGLAYSVLDRQLSVGAELQVETTDGGRHGRSVLSEAWILAGPSLQWRPVPPMHVDLVLLFGALGDRDETDTFAFDAGMRTWLVIGWEL